MKKNFWGVFLIIILMILICRKSPHMIGDTDIVAYPESDATNGNVSFNNNLYTLKDFKIPTEYIENKLGKTRALVNDERKYCKIYQISSISQFCAIALENGNGDYYLCINLEYVPKDYGEWIKALHLNDNLTINSVELHNKTTGEVTALEKNIQNSFSQFLLELPSNIQSCQLLNPVSELEKSDDWILISVNIDILGIKNHNISIYSTGYYITNITYNQQCFYIGKEQYSLLRSYFRSK